MSADILAEFGGPAAKQAVQASIAATAPDANGDEGWGEFETAQPIPPSLQWLFDSQSAPQKCPKPEQQQKVAQKQRTRIIRASTLDIINNTLIDIGQSPVRRPWAPPPLVPAPGCRVSIPTLGDRKTNFIAPFDADYFGHVAIGEDGDEFGDFQTGQLSATSSSDVCDLLSPDYTSTTASSTMNSGARDSHAPLKIPDLISSMTTISSTKTPALMCSQPPVQGNVATLTSKPRSYMPLPLSQPAAAAVNGPGCDTLEFDSMRRDNSIRGIARDRTNTVTHDKDSTTSEAPPINIPPPSVLLSLFSSLFNEANAAIKAAVAPKPPGVVDPEDTDLATAQFLHGYLLDATVAGRVLAGRKLRWQRDRFLARGLTVSAAGARGMKLTSVDRSRAAREDVEAAEVVAGWQQQVGRLRQAVAAANALASRPPLRVPEITQTIAVRKEIAVPTASQACALCGLRRDERVVKVEIEVEDSFGEWWVEHWGHRTCRSFWKGHEARLRQR